MIREKGFMDGPEKIKRLKVELERLSAQHTHPHDSFISLALTEAIEAVISGNFGVGAVLVDQNTKVVERGQNRVFHPYFRSDLHAEMDLMTRFEEKERNSQRISKLTLFTSLEPCPMCFSRLITSGIQKVYYAAKDEKGGMVHLHGNMPETWRDLMKSKQFSVADCSNPLKKIALDIFLSTAAELDGKLKRLQRVSE